MSKNYDEADESSAALLERDGEDRDEEQAEEAEDQEEAEEEKPMPAPKRKGKVKYTVKRKQLANASIKVAQKQIEQSLRARAPRFDEIAKSEAQYRGEKSKALRGRHNVEFDSVVARGFIDTLMSKVDESLEISFERAPGREQDKKAAEKLSAVCDTLRGPDQGAWDMVDIGVKKLAAFSGRGIYKKFSSRSGGKFCDYLEAVDHWDFITEVNGGGWLDKHLYKGQLNIFRTKSELEANVKSGAYDDGQYAKLCDKANDTTFKRNQTLYTQKMSRAASMGLDAEQNNFIGSKLFRLVEFVHYFRGNWYYMVFDYDTGIWLQHDLLSDVFSIAKKKPGRGPWVSWATNFDPFEFWSIAPMDSVRPIAYSMKKVLNYALDNLEKRNWQMRAYNPNVFNPRDLLWKDGGLAKANIRAGEPLNNNLITLETPDTTSITVNVVEYLNNFIGEKTGITPGAMGKSDEDKVSIYFGNIQQVADRLGLTNKMYQQAHVDIGVNLKYGLFDHMTEEYAVKMIGNKGIEYNEVLKRSELQSDFVVRIRGGNTEEKMNAALAMRKEKSLTMIANNKTLMAATNSAWFLREVLKLGGWSSEEIKVASDPKSDYDDDLLAEAAQSIEDILAGDKPKLNRGANSGFVQKILNFAYDTELERKDFDALLEYAKAHVPIVAENMARKVASAMVTQGLRGTARGAVKEAGALGEATGEEMVDMEEPALPTPAGGGRVPGADMGAGRMA